MNKILITLLLLSLGLLLACKKDDAKVIPGPDKPTDASGELTSEKRVAILNDLEKKFASLDWNNKTAAYQQLVSHLKTIPQFEEVGISSDEGNVWARFKDGRVLVLSNNRKPTANTNPDNVRLGYESQNNARIGLPTSSQVALMNATGNYYIGGKTNLRGLANTFGGKGYSVSTLPGSISKLIETKEEGVFYFNGHGGFGRSKEGKDRYCLASADSVFNFDDTGYHGELEQGLLYYFMGFADKGPDGDPIVQTTYAITAKFVDKHMSFSQNALIYIDANSSIADPDFVQAFLKKTKHTGIYLGWTGDVGDLTAYETSKYFFDRTLGANNEDVRPETPKQRPFDPTQVFLDMVKKDIGIYKDPVNPSKISTLTYQASPNHLTLLSPSIEYMYVDEATDRLILLGQFGEDPGVGKRSVKLNLTNELTIEQWHHYKIICKIASSDFGDVVVKVGDHSSNARRLTRWKGKITYIRPSEGSLVEKVVFDIMLRADINVFRKNPGEQPRGYWEALQLVPYISVSKESKAYYTMGGQGTSEYSEDCHNTHTIKWAHGEGEIPWVAPGKDGTSFKRFFQTKIQLTKEGFKVNLSVYVEKATTRTETIYQQCPKGSHYSNNDHPVSVHLTDIPAEVNEFVLPFNGNDILAGTKVKHLTGHAGLHHNAGKVPTFPVRIEWNDMYALSYPLPNAAVRVDFQ
jgi:hypothetical protein